MSTVKRRHHYVWRRYLMSWATQDRVWCRRDGKVFDTDPVNLALQRDFYKLRPLSRIDVLYIRKMIEQLRDPVVRAHNLRLLGRFELASGAAFATPPEGVDAAWFRETQTLLAHNFDEDMHGLLEELEEPHFEDLLSGDGQGLSGRRIAFLHFMAGQLMRTKGMHDTVVRNLAPAMEQLGADVKNCWPVLRHAFANSVAASFACDGSFGLYLIRNESEVPFLTGDQPVVNTKGEPKQRDRPPIECELYYPISPTRAVIVSNSSGWEGCSVSVDQALWLNQVMVENSHEMVFASGREQLAVGPVRHGGRYERIRRCPGGSLR